MKPVQNAEHDSRVMESLAYVLSFNARPFVASVQQPWKANAPTVDLMAGPVGVGAAELLLVVVVVLVLSMPVGVAEMAVSTGELDDVDEVWLEGVSMYSSSRLPAPQYSVLSPGQRKEQSSWLSALTLPARRALPQ